MSGAAATSTPGVEEMQIARVYAEAVWQAALKADATESLVEEYRSLLEDVLDAQPKLEVFFGLGSISQDRRAAMLDSIFKAHASPLLFSFLETLNRHNRLGLLRAVGICIEELWKKMQGRVPVLVRTAAALPDEQLEAVREMVADRFQVQPELQTEVDPSLLGGLWLRIGDTVYDRSVRSNLIQLRENILTRYSHEIQSGRDIVDRSTGD